MKIAASEFLAHARLVQDQQWQTHYQKRPFTYVVENEELRITPATRSERLISKKEIARFCEIYSETNSRKTLDYRALFNSSYLLAIAIAMNSRQLLIKAQRPFDLIPDPVEGKR